MTDKRPSVVERWKGGKYGDDEINALPTTIELVDVAKSWGLGQEYAYREVKQNYDPNTKRSMLAGVPLMKLGRRWVGTKADLLRALGLERRDGAA